MTPTQAIQEYTPLVKYHVYKWTKAFPRLRARRDDLMQDGFEGLLYAVSKFNPDRGPFNSLAFTCVRQHIRAGAARLLSLTHRNKRAPIVVDHCDLDEDGNALDPDSLVGWSRNPEELVGLQEVANQFATRMRRRGRNGTIYHKHISADESTGGRRPRDQSDSAIAREYGLSKERIRQIIQNVEQSVKAWGGRIEAEVA